jgi:hypothetical protein
VWQCNGDAQSASLREKPLRATSGLPRKAISPRPHHAGEGRAPHARKESMTPTLTLPPFGYRLVVNPSGGNASARIRPCHTGAETAPLRENHLSRHLRPFPARPSQLGWPPRGGAGSARPQGRHGPPRHVPGRPPAVYPASGRPYHADAQSASLRENRPHRYPRVCPARPS